jgi:hypothetical protein
VIRPKAPWPCTNSTRAGASGATTHPPMSAVPATLDHRRSGGRLDDTHAGRPLDVGVVNTGTPADTAERARRPTLTFLRAWGQTQFRARTRSPARAACRRNAANPVRHFPAVTLSRAQELDRNDGMWQALSMRSRDGASDRQQGLPGLMR